VGLPRPQSGSAGDEGVGTQAEGAAHSSHLAKEVSGPAPVTRDPQTEPCTDTPLHLPGKGNTCDEAPQPAQEKSGPLVIHAKSSALPPGRVAHCPSQAPAAVGWGVKARATLQTPFKDVPFSGVFPSGSHTKGRTTQRDDEGAGWHDRVGKPREAAGGLHSATAVLGAAGLAESHQKGHAGRDGAASVVVNLRSMPHF